MRRNRIILYILWVLSLVGISFYGGPVTYGFFFIVTLIPIVSLAYIGVVMLCFRTYQKIGTRNPIVNTPTPFFFTMQNGAFFTFSGIKLNFHSSFSTITGLDGNQEYELSPFTEITKETQLVCKYRGHYDVGVKSFEITDFLRLFKIRFSLKDSLNEIVNPYLAEISSLKGFDSAKFLPRNSYSNPTETDCEVRDFVPGDSLRRIHWNISAKEHALKVRKTIGEEKQGVTIMRLNYTIRPIIPITTELSIHRLNIHCLKRNIFSHPPKRLMSIRRVRSRFRMWVTRLFSTDSTDWERIMKLHTLR